MKIALFCLAAVVVLITGCQLDKPDFTGTHPTGAGTGTTTTTTTTTTSSGNYSPTTAGSYWKYSQNNIGLNTDTLTATATGTSTVINGKTYAVINTESKSLGKTTVYYYNSNHAYSVRQTTTSSSVVITVELEYLIDTTAVGHSWTAKVSDDGTINGVPAQLIGTVLEKGVTKVVSGKQFTNVIHTQLNLQYDYGTGFSTIATYDYYTAQGIGYIEVDTSLSGTLVTSTTLFEYLIK